MHFLRSWWSKKVASPTPPPNVAPVDSRNCGLVDAVQSGWYQNTTDELFKGFKISADDVVLDVGCGAGGATLFCAQRGAHVVFTDSVPEKVAALIEKVKYTPARRAEGWVSDSCPLPISDEYASKIILLEVLEHVDNPAQVLNELVRVARPGAQLLLVVPDAAGEKLQQNLAPPSYFSRPNHIHVFGREQFAGLVEGAGLVIEHRDTYGFYWLMWMLLYWTSAKATGIEDKAVSHDVVHPPYPPLVAEWAALWQHLIRMPESAELKRSLDTLLPKSQIIIARKPVLP